MGLGTCPICKQPNGCALVAGDGIQDCWCASTSFPPGIFDQVPPNAQGCICRRCIANFEANLLKK